jgi:hypothetical protein
MRSPSAEKLSVNFTEVGYEYVDRWNQSVKDGTMVIIRQPDRSSLYLDTYLNKADQNYIARAFWNQRWSRYASFAKLWLPILAIPPVVLFLLGWSILRVCRGFKAASKG